MTTEKIISVIEIYEKRLREADIPKIRMDPQRTFGSLTKEEMLAHAHFLCDGIRIYAKDPEKEGKTGRHLASIQLCLSFAGWYTLKDLMDHNRPHSKK